MTKKLIMTEKNNFSQKEIKKKPFTQGIRKKKE
jgi:hypothetical protein